MTKPLVNIIANYGSRVFSLVILYFFTPIYINLVGIENYAIIYFYNVVFGIVTLADIGIASAIDREFAKTNTINYKLSLLKLFEKIYFALCLFITALIQVFAEEIAENWLRAHTLASNQLVVYIRLIGVAVSLQLIPIIYHGALMGLQQQARVGIIILFTQVVRSVGGILLLSQAQGNLILFFSWFALCNLLYTIYSRYAVFSQGKPDSSKLTLSTIPLDIRNYLAGMFFVATLSALNLQTDKLMTSKLLTLLDYGYYALATVLPQAPHLLAVPIVLAVFPFLTMKVSENKIREIVPVFFRFSFLVASITLPVCATLLIYGREIFQLWQKDLHVEPNMMDNISFVMGCLVMGNTFVALQQTSFYFLLAKGKTRFSIIQNTFQILLQIPGILYAINKFGIIGAAIPYLIVNILGFLYIITILSKELLREKTLSFVVSTLIVPVLVTSTCTGIVWLTSTLFESMIVISAMLACIFSFLANLIIFNILNPKAKVNFNKLF